MNSTPPPRTDAELAAAAAVGLSYRRSRSAIKAAIHAGTISLEGVLEAGHHGVGDHVLGRMEIRHALDACPAWGPVKVAKLLERVGVHPKTHLDELTAAQRAAIADAVAAQQAALHRHR
jgi:hypothetical protein